MVVKWALGMDRTPHPTRGGPVMAEDKMVAMATRLTLPTQWEEGKRENGTV